MEKTIKSWIVKKRRTNIVRLTARTASRFLNAYYNTGNYDFAENGEELALSTFAAHAPERPVIWDVGAHQGDYAREAHRIMPQAKVVSFEILPPIAEQLQQLAGTWLEVKPFGLSDTAGIVDVVWNKKADTTNAIKPYASEFFDHDELEKVSCSVTTIDQLIHEGEAAPHFLKIDVEGHEGAVLDGARKLLFGPSAPKVIQFEYGMTWIPSSRLLSTTQAMLEEAGYKVGRLFPDYVEFKEHNWTDEHFRMGNMLAVKDADIFAALS